MINSHRVATGVMLVCASLSGAASLSAQILSKPPISSPTVYAGAPPANFHITGTTPVSASFAWDAAAGGMTYTVMRTTGVGQPWTTLTPTPLPASMLFFTDNSGIDYRTTYTYRLQVNYSSTPPGSVDLPVTLSKPTNPSGLTAKQSGDGSVTVSWTPVAGVTTYTVFGPGVTGGALTVANASAVATGLPLGTQTWNVASVYSGNITSPATEFPSVSTAVEKWTGTYRVSLLGFTNQGTTTDDPFDGDGKGDEIMPSVYWQRFEDGTSPRLADQNWARGSVHGDNGKNFRSRVRAGSGQPSGGILANDVVPGGFIGGTATTSTMQTAKSSTAVTFPITIWEGQLTRNRDVLVIYPSLWETDEHPEIFRNLYESEIAARTANALGNTAVRSALDQSGMSEVRGNIALQFPAHGIFIPADRPIGVEAVAGRSGGSDAAFFDRMIVLNLKKIEEELTKPPKYPGLPAGTIGLSFFEPGLIWGQLPDAYNFSGKYVLYLRVEVLR